MNIDWTAVWLFVISIIVGAFGYLLNDRNQKQQAEMDEEKHIRAAEIARLQLQHELDARELGQLQLEIARNHYPKTELDARFLQLNATIHDGFRALSADVKEMTQAFHEHLKDSK